MTHQANEDRWPDLESDAHLPEVQKIIREGIRNGSIRVQPKPGGGICVVPMHMPDNVEVREMEAPAVPAHDGRSPLGRAVRRRQVAPVIRP
jgi:hypothetical protein